MMKNNIHNTVLRNPIHFISFGFGSGLSPIAPGTMGTIVAIPIFLLVSDLPIIYYLTCVIFIFILGCWSSAATAKALKVHDHPGIVIDEIAGYLITMILVPATWYWVILGFVLFRLFDIWKPSLVGWADRRGKGGLGIMLDDVLAGIFSLLSLNLAIWSVENLQIMT